MKLPHLFLVCWSVSALVLATQASAAAAAPADEVSPAQPVIPDRTFNMREFGAVADGKTSNNEAFQRAVAAVNQSGGGRLIVPAGIYFTSAFELCSAINLHLDAGATILFSPDEKPLAGRKNFPPLLLTKDAHDVMISGSGTINGSGEAWWGAVHETMHGKKPAAPRPQSMVGFDRCVRVRVEGITLTHSPEYGLVPSHCQDVTIEGITIYNPAGDITAVDGIDPAQVRQQLQRQYDDESPNTDGIDPWDSQRVLIAHCRIDTGDDCIAIKAGSGALTEDILITDCTFLHGHGCSVGSGTQGGLRNLTIRRCTFDGTHVGVNLKSARDRGGVVENLLFADLTMKNVGEAFVITSYYPQIGPPIYFRPYQKDFSIAIADGGHDQAQPVTATTPRWTGITIRNVTASCLWEAGLILGLPEMPAEHIVLDNVVITAPEGLRIRYAKNVTLREVKIEPKHGSPVMVSDTVEGLNR